MFLYGGNVDFHCPPKDVFGLGRSYYRYWIALLNLRRCSVFGVCVDRERMCAHARGSVVLQPYKSKTYSC